MCRQKGGWTWAWVQTLGWYCSADIPFVTTDASLPNSQWTPRIPIIIHGWAVQMFPPKLVHFLNTSRHVSKVLYKAYHILWKLRGIFLRSIILLRYSKSGLKPSSTHFPEVKFLCNFFHTCRDFLILAEAGSGNLRPPPEKLTCVLNSSPAKDRKYWNPHGKACYIVFRAKGVDPFQIRDLKKVNAYAGWIFQNLPISALFSGFVMSIDLV